LRSLSFGIDVGGLCSLEAFLIPFGAPPPLGGGLFGFLEWMVCFSP